MNTLSLRIGRFLVSAAAITVVGCGGGDQNNNPDGAFIGCVGATDIDAYSAGMMKTGKSGKLSVELVSSDPGPPIKGINKWNVLVKDAAGAPLDGAAIKVTPYMPAHRHGTQVDAVVTPASGGVYNIAPLYLYMAGVWQTTLDVTSSDGATTDSVVFSFCIDG